MIGILFIALFALVLIGTPIAIALGLSSMIFFASDGLPLTTMAQNLFGSLDAFTLLAVPFFILAGNLMASGGISKRLINLANVLVGWIRGGLGAVTVLTSMFFATLSGSSSATIASVGSILIPAMKKKGYPNDFSTALTASAGGLGVIIPPSIAMIVYGLSANVSIGSLFLGGILPGILIGLSLMLTIYIVARIKGFDKLSEIPRRQWMRTFIKAFADSILALLMPIIILGGIYTGLFTPTEAAVIAVVYGFIVGKFIYRELKWEDIIKILSDSAITTAIIMIIVGFAASFGYILTINMVPHKVGEAILSFSDNPIVFLLLVNIMLLIVGMFMETLASIIILTPILAPVAMEFGIDPVHFGIVVVVNLAIGMVTPPLGINLFVAGEIAKIKLEEMMKPLLLFVGVLVLDILIITYIPAITTWIPSLSN